MIRQQWIAVTAAAALFLALYFGCDTKINELPQMKPAADTNQSVAINVQSLIATAKTALNPTQSAQINTLDEKVSTAHGKIEKIAALKEMSGAWHLIGKDDIAATYAQQVAEAENTDTAWSVAGGNYFLALQATTDKPLRDFWSEKAVNAFQKAAALNPNSVEHKINEALVDVENPPQGAPMTAVLLLQDLERKNPTNMAVPIQLARLAMKTGQFDRAIARLEKVLQREPDNKRAICLLADAYEKTGSEKAALFNQKCNANH